MEFALVRVEGKGYGARDITRQAGGLRRDGAPWPEPPFEMGISEAVSREGAERLSRHRQRVMRFAIIVTNNTMRVCDHEGISWAEGKDATVVKSWPLFISAGQAGQPLGSNQCMAHLEFTAGVSKHTEPVEGLHTTCPNSKIQETNRNHSISHSPYQRGEPFIPGRSIKN